VRAAPSRVDAVGGELQQDPVEEDAITTPKDKKEKKPKKEKRGKSSKDDDLLSKKQQEANALLDKWRELAE
jgi:hypothetical protein